MAGNFDIPVANGAYSGSDRARSAMRSATSGKAMAGDTGPATQSDMPTKTASVNDNLQRSKQTVMSPMSKPAIGATPPSNVDGMQRPGEGASKTNALGKGGR